MKKGIRCLLIFALSVLLFSCDKTAPKQETLPAKYVFLFIGDGMGQAHVSLTEAYLANSDGSIGVEKLKMSEFPVHGICNTFCENRQITGSAASGTAISTGNKTGVSIIGKNIDCSEDYYSIAKQISEAGMYIGIISTVGINHATPASFYAHSNKRNLYYEIGEQLFESGFDYFGGGGFMYPEGKLGDSKNLYERTEEGGYTVLREKVDIKKSQKLPMMLVNPILGSDAEMPFAIDPDYKKGYAMHDIISNIIACFGDTKGFFIMAESGLIDWAAHGNDAATIVHEVIEFDKAIAVAYQFYLEHPDETLIIVTADHETGGLSLGTAALEYDSYFEFLGNQKYSYAHIESVLIDFMNEDVRWDDLLQCVDTLCFNNEIELTADELKLLRSAFDYMKTGNSMSSELDAYLLDGDYCPITSAIINIINTRAGVGFNTWSHTAIPVPVMAIGVGSERFNSYYDNTDIPKYILQAMHLAN
jgi:alkaline phosphatase